MKINRLKIKTRNRRVTHSMLCRTSTSWVFWSGAMRANTVALSTSCSATVRGHRELHLFTQVQKAEGVLIIIWECTCTSLYLLDELRKVFDDDSEGSAAHSEVVAVLLWRNDPVPGAFTQLNFHGLKEKMRQSNPGTSLHSFFRVRGHATELLKNV